MLSIRQLKKSFTQPDGARVAVLDLPSFDLAQGEQVLLMGRSGCGKTTLLHIIAGITTPDSGTVEIAGLNLTKLSEAARDRFRAQHLGYVFQTFNLLAGFTALENVLLAMSFTGRRSDESRARQLLDRVGLGHRLTHRPAQLSVGEQQRVAVARALVNRPQLLLADEPTANVDARNQQQIVDLLREQCREENVSLLIVTHAPEVARQFERVEHLEQLNQALSTAGGVA